MSKLQEIVNRRWQASTDIDNGLYTGAVALSPDYAEAAALTLEFPGREHTPQEIARTYLRNRSNVTTSSGKVVPVQNRGSWMGYTDYLNDNRTPYDKTRSIFERESGASAWPERRLLETNGGVAVPEGSARVVKSTMYGKPMYTLVMNKFDPSSIAPSSWMGIKESMAVNPQTPTGRFTMLGTPREGWFIPPH